jgi:hypothetical protein
MSVFKDPFFYIGLGGAIVHFLQYYGILDKIAEKIKRRKDQAILRIEEQIETKPPSKKIIELHSEIHTLADKYGSLNRFVLMNFFSGVAFIVLCAIGWSRNFIPVITPDFVTGVIIYIIVAVVVWFITLVRLLYWNLVVKE